MTHKNVPFFFDKILSSIGFACVESVSACDGVALFEGGRELSGSDDRRLLAPEDVATSTDPSVGMELFCEEFISSEAIGSANPPDPCNFVSLFHTLMNSAAVVVFLNFSLKSDLFHSKFCRFKTIL